LIFGTWNVRTLFKTGALLSLLSRLKEYRLAITALQEKRKLLHHKTSGKTKKQMDDVVQRDALQLLGIRRWGRRAENRDE